MRLTLSPEEKEIFEDASNFDDYVYPSKIQAAMDVIKQKFSNGIQAAMDVPNKKRFFSGGNKKKSKKFQKGGGGKFSEMWNRGSVSIKNDRVSRGLFDRLKGRSYLRTSSALSKMKQYIPDLPSRLRNIGRTYNPSAFLKLTQDFFSKLPENFDPRQVLERLQKILQDPNNPKIPKDTFDEVQDLLNPNEPDEKKIGGKRRTSKNKSYKGGEPFTIIALIVFLAIMFAIYLSACNFRLKFVIVFVENKPVFEEKDAKKFYEFLDLKKENEAKCCGFGTFLFRVLLKICLSLLHITGLIIYVLWTLFNGLAHIVTLNGITEDLKNLPRDFKQIVTDVGDDVSDGLTSVDNRDDYNDRFGIGPSETD